VKMLLIGLAALGICIFVMQVVLGEPVGNDPGSDMLALTLTMGLCVGLPVLFLRYSMVTEIHGGGIRVRMMKKMNISTADIESFHAKRFSWLKEYMGIGYRIGPHGVGFIMGGDIGVMLHLRDGRKVMIESDHHEEFLQALELVTRKERSAMVGLEESPYIDLKARSQS